MANETAETYRILLRALPHRTPAANRLRTLLKIALRGFKLRAEDVSPVPDPDATAESVRGQVAELAKLLASIDGSLAAHGDRLAEDLLRRTGATVWEALSGGRLLAAKAERPPRGRRRVKTTEGAGPGVSVADTAEVAGEPRGE